MLSVFNADFNINVRYMSRYARNIKRALEKYANRVSLVFGKATSVPRNTRRSITAVLHARVLGQAAVPSDTWKYLANVLFVLTNKSQSGEHSTIRTSLAAATPKSKVHLAHPVYRYCRHALMNEPFVSWQSCGRYLPRVPFYNTAVGRPRLPKYPN